MRLPIKLLPITIAVAALALVVRVGAVWEGADNLIGAAPAASAENKATGDGAATEGAAGENRANAPILPASGSEQIDVTDLSPAEIQVLESLAARRREIEARARDLDMREKLLAAAEKRLDEKIAKLKELRDSIESMFASADAENEAQIASLVKMYERMKPKDAARIFDKLDLKVLIEVVDRMKEAKAALVLAKMNVDKARTVTLELAKRREVPPEARRSGAAAKVN